MKLLALVCFAALAVGATGCGKDVTDAAKASSALAKSGAKGMLLQANQLRIQQLRETAKGQMWLARFETEAKALNAMGATSICSSFTELTDASCSAGSGTGSFQSADGTTTTCDVSCSGTTQTTKCTLTGEVTAACGATTYTYKDGSFSLTMPPATCTESGSSATLTIGFSLNVAASFKGGDVDDFTKLDCTMALNLKMNMDFTNPSAPSFSATNDVDTASSFSCSIDGSTIDADDMKEEAGSNAC